MIVHYLNECVFLLLQLLGVRLMFGSCFPLYKYGLCCFLFISPSGVTGLFHCVAFFTSVTLVSLCFLFSHFPFHCFTFSYFLLFHCSFVSFLSSFHCIAFSISSIPVLIGLHSLNFYQFHCCFLFHCVAFSISPPILFLYAVLLCHHCCVKRVQSCAHSP